MQFRQMEVFYEIMQRGSVSAAAAHLQLSQPSVSKILQQLESELGYALFDRIRGRLFPTDEARALFKEVKHAYASLDSVRQLGRRLGSSYVGHFRVAAPPSLALELLPEAVTIFNRRYRGVTIELSTQHSGDILGAEGRLHSRFDLGFTHGAEIAPGLGVVELARAPVMCAVSRSLFSTDASSIAIHEVAKLPFIGLDETEPLGRHVREACEQAGIALDVRIRAHAHHAALALASRGEGFAIIDWFTARFFMGRPDCSDLVLVPLAPPANLPVTAVYFALEGLPLAGRRFIDAVQEALVALMPVATPESA